MSFDEIHEGKHYRVLLRNQDRWFKEASPFPHGVIASDHPRTQSSDRDQEIMRSFGKCVGWKVPRVCILEVRDCLLAHRNGSATRPESNPSIHMGFFHSLFKLHCRRLCCGASSTVSQTWGRRRVTRQQRTAALGLPGVGASLVSVLVHWKQITYGSSITYRPVEPYKSNGCRTGLGTKFAFCGVQRW